jgi:hypothetical protein
MPGQRRHDQTKQHHYRADADPRCLDDESARSAGEAIEAVARTVLRIAKSFIFWAVKSSRPHW